MSFDIRFDQEKKILILTVGETFIVDTHGQARGTLL
jgi:hypothetical protein